MSFGISVKGGTGAGRKRPLTPANTIPWACACFGPDRPSGNAHTPIARDAKRNPGYLKRCIDCGTSRDPS
jgi:hypothetical protein